MKNNWFKRTLCSILAFVMVLGYVPATAFASEADGLCEHHPQHTTECGYSAAVAGHDCGHAHTEECYQSVTECVHSHGDCGYVPAVEGQSCDCQPDENGEIVHTEGCGYVEAVAEVPCGHVCSEETGCVKQVLDCQHVHDGNCGYVEAKAEAPCAYDCEECSQEPLEPDIAMYSFDTTLMSSTGSVTCEQVTTKVLQYKSIIEQWCSSNNTTTAYWNAHVRSSSSSCIDGKMSYSDPTGYIKSRVNEGDYTSYLTATPCPGGSHSHGSNTCYSNEFGAAHQCNGYANYMNYIVFGLTHKDSNGSVTSGFENFNFVPGDIAIYSKVGSPNIHFRYIYDVDDTYVYYVAGNDDGRCGIRFSKMTIAEARNGYTTTAFRPLSEVFKSAAVDADTVRGSHTHTIARENEKVHPHKEYEWCTDPSCDYWAYTGKTMAVIARENEKVHPHKEYEWCTDPSCDYWAYTGKTMAVIARENEKVHPHKEYEWCTDPSCDYWAYTGKTMAVIARENEKVHPHKEYEWCTDPSCNYWAYTGNTIEVSDCIQCNPPVYYSFDLNGYLDNVESPDLGDYGTCDVYINGERVADDCTDYYNPQIPKGSTYEIRDIRAKEGYDYIGYYIGPLSGTLSSNTEVSLRIFTRPKLTLLTSQVTLDLVNTTAKGIYYERANTGYQYGTYISCSDLDVASTDSSQPNSITVTARKAGTCTIKIELKDTLSPSIVYDSATCQVTVLPSGSCGDNLTWILAADGTLTISGTGDMANYTDVSSDGTQGTPAPWYSIREDISKIVIEEGVTSVGTWAFNNCTNVTDVSLPDSLTAIGEAAFFGCSSLSSISIPDHITELKNLSFAYCTELTSVNLPDGLQLIGDNAFMYCSKLSSISLPDNVSAIGSGSFQGAGLSAITIPSSVASIGMYAFFDCTALKAVTIPDTVMFIGDYAFGFYGEAKPYSKVDDFAITTPRASEGYFYAKEHDIALITQGVCVPNFIFAGVATRDLNANAYYDDSALGIISKGNMVWPYVTSYMDDDSKWGLVMGMQDTDGSITWGKFSAEELADTTKELIRGWVSLDGVKEVPYGTCGDHLTWILVDGVLTISGTGEMDGMVAQKIECVGPWKDVKDDIRSVVIEEGVTSIGAQCFTFCTNLESVTIPATVETIGHFAFFGSGLKQVSIPAGVREIGHAALSYCPNLESIAVARDNADADFRLVDGALYDRNVTYLTTYPARKMDASFTLPDSVTYIDDFACSFAQFKEVILPKNLSGIGSCAFEGCANLEKISIPASVSRIRSAFANCNRLTEITFAHSASHRLNIEKDAFQLNATVATKILVPNANKIHSAISGYDWAASKRTVRYESLPRAESILLMRGDTVLGNTLDLDMKDSASLTLSAQFQPASTQQPVTWTSSSTAVAKVDKNTGEVTLLKPGSTVVKATATDGSNMTASVTLKVFYLDSAGTLKAAFENPLPAIGLQPGQTAKMIVTGANAIAAENLTFTSSNANIAAVDDTGTITAGTTPGTTTITAKLKNDPLSRKATLPVKVIAMQAESLTLTVYGEEMGGTIVLPMDTDSRSLVLAASGRDYTGRTFTPKVIWTSSDTSVAKVDASGMMTIPAGASGECVITAKANDLNKASAQLTVSVRDFSPRLASSSITLNSYSQQGVALDLRESYDNAIVSAALTNEPAGFRLDSDTLTLYAEGVKNGTYKNIRLDVTCEDGETYSYNLQVKVMSSLPAVTVKQTEKLNLFYTDSTAALSITAPGQTIKKIALTGTPDFQVEESAGGVYVLSRTDTQPKKLTTRATLEVTLAGYNTPVTKAITISTATTAPRLSLTPASAVVRQADDIDPKVTLQVVDAEGHSIDPQCIACTPDFANVEKNAQSLVLTLTKKNSKGVYTGGTASLQVQLPTWTKPVALKCKITVSTKSPTMKLGTASLTLRHYFAEEAAQTTVTLDQRNLALKDVTIVSTSRASAEAAKLDVTYESGVITARIKDANQLPKAGTYTYSCTGKTDAGDTKSVTLKVAVSAAQPKVTLSAKGKLDTLNPDSAIVYTPKLTNCIGGIDGVSLAGQDGNKFCAKSVDGNIVLTLRDEVDYATNLTYKVQFRISVCGKEILSPVMNIKVTQSSVKFVADPAALILYQSQTVPLTARLKASAGEIARICVNSKTSAELKAALETNPLTITSNGSTAELKLDLAGSDLLKAGKSYTLYLDVIPVNNAKNLNPAQIKLTVKVLK